MFAQRLWIAAALAASCVLAPLARAQGTGGSGGSTSSGQGNVRVTLISVGKEEVDTVGAIYINRRQCNDNADLLFKVDYVQGQPSLDIYTGANCNSASNRGNSTNLSCTWLVNVPTGNVTMGLMLHIPAKSLLENCDDATESTPKLWFIPVPQKMSVDEVGKNYAFFDRIKVDTALPTPPLNVRGGEGENTIPISWQGGQTNLKGFRVYVDPSAGAPGSGGAGTSSSDQDTDTDTTDADAAIIDAGEGVIPTGSVDGGVQIAGPNPNCPSSVLVGGGDPADLPESIRKKTIDEPTGTSTTLTPSQIGGTHAAIAIVAIDLAGNESVISEVECVDVVETTGFWDRYQENGGEVPTGCPCSAVGPAQIESAWPVGLAVLALGLSARRRRSS